MATSNSSHTENASVPSALEAALEILRSSDFSVDDLPKKLNSPLWFRLEKELGLTLGQLSSLQNYVESKISATPADELVTGDEKKRVACNPNFMDVIFLQAMMFPLLFCPSLQASKKP